MPMVSCPACTAKLKVPDHLAGKKIRCPKCQDVINVPAESAESAVAAGPAPRKAAAGAAANSSGVRAGAKSGPPVNGVRPTAKSAPPPRKRPVADEDDEDDRDEEDEGEDEAPKKSKRGKKRKQKGLPIALLAGVGGVLVLALLVGVYFMFFAGGDNTKIAGNPGGGGNNNPGGGNNNPGGNNPGGGNNVAQLGPDAKYLPESTEMIISCRVADAMSSSAFTKLRQEIPLLEQALSQTKEIKDKMGIGVEEIESVLAGGNMTPKDADMVAVIRTTKDIPVQTLLQAISEKSKPNEEKVGDITIYSSPTGKEALCLVGAKQMLFSSSTALLKAALQRSAPPTLPAELQTALGEVKMSSTLAVALSTKSLVPQTNKPPIGQPIPGGPPGGIPQPPGGIPQPPGGVPQPPGGIPQPPGGIPQPPGGIPQPPGGIPQPPGGVPQPPGGQPIPGGQPGAGGGMEKLAPSAIALEVNLTTNIDIKSIAFYGNEQNCKDATDLVKGGLTAMKLKNDVPPQLKGVLDAVKVENQGPRLLIQVNLEPTTVATAVKGATSGGGLPTLPPDILKLIGGGGGPVQPPRK